MRFWGTTLLSTSAAVVMALAPAAASAEVTSPDACNVVAAPSGSDSAAGTVDQPVRSAAGLASRLDDGQTGCFRAGTYNFEELHIDAARATVTSFPGEQATLRGQLRLEREATATTVENLSLNGANRIDGFSPLIYADDVVIRDNDISNERTTNCLHVARYYDEPAPDGVLVEDNRIHDCGGHDPNHDHGIYIASSTNLVIRDNEIYDNADRGVQLWPDAQHTKITGNVIDGNGQGISFGGYQGETTNHTLVENNVITNSNVRFNVESYWHDDVGTDNIVRNNCIYGAEGWYGDNGSGIGDQVGFTAKDNIVAPPRFVNQAANDFAIAGDSPCAGVLDGEVAPEAPRPIELDASRPRVPQGAVTTLVGTVPTGVGEVWIKVKRRGKWRRAGSGHVRGNRFRAKVLVSKTTRYKASAHGALDSNAVKVAAVAAKRDKRD
jgi:Right handed beta helix region